MLLAKSNWEHVPTIQEMNSSNCWISDMDFTGVWDEEPDAEGQVHRVISYTLTLTNPLGPKNSYVTERQVCTHYCLFSPNITTALLCVCSSEGSC